MQDPLTGPAFDLGSEYAHWFRRVRLGEPQTVGTLQIHPLRLEGDAGAAEMLLHEALETKALEVIRDLGLELQVIFNKGAVMILPSGVNKATGLTTALQGLGLSPQNVVGVGDAENDHAFLSLCGYSVAVQNALDTVKLEVDWITTEPNGDGTVQLIRTLIATDLEQSA